MSAEASVLDLLRLEGDVVPLSRRERDVLRQLAQGKTDRQIAMLLSLSGKTVGHHVQSILPKLEARNRTHVVALGLTRGLIHLD